MEMISFLVVGAIWFSTGALVHALVAEWRRQHAQKIRLARELHYHESRRPSAYGN